MGHAEIAGDATRQKSGDSIMTTRASLRLPGIPWLRLQHLLDLAQHHVPLFGGRPGDLLQ